MALDWRERIAVDPAILVGKPVVRGTCLAVEFVLGFIAGGWCFDEVVSNHPGLTVGDIRACVAYAREVVAAERVFPAARA